MGGYAMTQVKRGDSELSGIFWSVEIAQVLSSSELALVFFSSSNSDVFSSLAIHRKHWNWKLKSNAFTSVYRSRLQKSYFSESISFMREL